MATLAAMVVLIWRGFPSPAAPRVVPRSPTPSAEYLAIPPKATFSVMRTEEFSRRSGFGPGGNLDKIPNDIFAPAPGIPPVDRMAHAKPRPESIPLRLAEGYSAEATSPVIPRLPPSPVAAGDAGRPRAYMSKSLESAGFSFSLDGLAPAIAIPRTRFYIETDAGGRVAHVLVDKPSPSPAIAREAREIRAALEKGRAATNASGYVEISFAPLP